MSIRLRKINHPKETKQQIRQHQEQKIILWQRVMKTVGLLVALSAGLYIYLQYYAPPSGIVLLEAQIDNVISPVYARIKWIKNIDQNINIVSGEKIAVINESSGNIVKDNRRLEETQIKLNQTRLILYDIETRREIWGNNTHQQEIEQELALTLAKESCIRGVIQTEKAKRIFDARKKELQNAERLWNLDALTKQDLLASRRMFADADAAYKNALPFEKSLNAEKEAVDKALTQLKKSKNAEENYFKDQLSAVSKNKEMLEDQIAYIKEVIKGTSDKDIVLTSPMSGKALSKGIKPGDFIRKGESLFSIFRHNSLSLTAYVPEKYQDNIQINQNAVIKIAGRTIHATVTKIYPQIILSPPQLRIRGTAPKNAYYFKIQLTPKESIEYLFQGQSGKVIFK